MHTHTALAVKAPRLQSSQISPAHTLCPSYNPRFMPSPPLQSPTLSVLQWYHIMTIHGGISSFQRHSLNQDSSPAGTR